MRESAYEHLAQRQHPRSTRLSKRGNNNQHEEMVVVPPPSPFVPNPSKRNEEREQKGKPHRFLAEGLVSRKSEPVMGEREDFE